MNNDNKEVRFDKYCETCEHNDKPGFEDPCNECLEHGMREGTEVPLNWKERENAG